MVKPLGMECGIPAYMTEEERQTIANLAKSVAPGALIVEIGTLYGATAAAIALANPEARLVSIDNYTWSPVKNMPASRELAAKNLARLGIENVELIEGDSRIIGRDWTEPIDLAVVDGGHAYGHISQDLDQFGRHATMIAAHDFGNRLWTSVSLAIFDFLVAHREFRPVLRGGMVVVLKRESRS